MPCLTWAGSPGNGKAAVASAAPLTIGPSTDRTRYELRRARSVGGERQEWEATLNAGGGPCRLLLICPATEPDVARWRRYCTQEFERLRALGRDGLLPVTAAFETADPFDPTHQLPIFAFATGPLPPTTFTAWAEGASRRSLDQSLNAFLPAARALDALHWADDGVTCFGLIRVEDVFVEGDQVRLPVLALLDDFPGKGPADDRRVFSELLYWGAVGTPVGSDRTPQRLRVDLHAPPVGTSPGDAPDLLSRLFTSEVQGAPLAPFIESVLALATAKPVVEPRLVGHERHEPTPRNPKRRWKWRSVMVSMIVVGVAGAIWASIASGSRDASSRPRLAQAVVTVADGLIVRSGPGRDFDRVASLNQGDWVEVVCSVSGDVVAAPVGDTPTWYRLAVGGYASGAFLDVQASPATPPC